MKLVPVKDIRAYWEPIRAYLEKLVDKVHPDWIPEDVFHAVRSGTAFVYIAPDGVAVFRCKQTEFDNETVLFLWAGYSTNGDAMVEYAADVEFIARSVGAAKIQFTSSRKGMEKQVTRLPGWTATEVVYEKRI